MFAMQKGKTIFLGGCLSKKRRQYSDCLVRSRCTSCKTDAAVQREKTRLTLRMTQPPGQCTMYIVQDAKSKERRQDSLWGWLSHPTRIALSSHGPPQGIVMFYIVHQTHWFLLWRGQFAYFWAIFPNTLPGEQDAYWKQIWSLWIMSFNIEKVIPRVWCTGCFFTLGLPLKVPSTRKLI